MTVPDCNFSSWKVKTVDLWGLITSLLSLISKLQIPARDLFQKTRRADNVAPWVRHPLRNLLAWVQFQGSSWEGRTDSTSCPLTATCLLIQNKEMHIKKNKKQNRKWVAPEEWYPRLTSGMSPHVLACVCAHTYHVSVMPKNKTSEGRRHSSTYLSTVCLVSLALPSSPLIMDPSHTIACWKDNDQRQEVFLELSWGDKNKVYLPLIGTNDRLK